ncbi:MULTISPECIES: HAD family hydrolase [Methylobacterium]|uniref:Hydrolase n=3 Tax=Pseudomonadota TaxID=1224 RepID=A0ABQ4SZ75_9HYPH|nr:MULTISPECIES: HAD family hydrolase [Methylobacterium]GBU18986.1 hypothetical protein AwMethylo_32010 [Methylobacterium sp.]GJE07516.1 hypothetical protein AOPFMNJM_2845 [Methylobacterium jeotgali]
MTAPSLAERWSERIEAAEVVSFDVFDTLFVRFVASPEDVFDLVGARHGLPDFRRRRIAAQRDAFRVMRAAGRREIDLDGIYAFLSDLGVAAETLKRSEWEIEQAVLRPNPEMLPVLAVARAAGKPCVLLSDMYLPRAFFEELCATHGLAFADLFVSSERQATKRDDGALFTLVAETLGVPPGRILHIGDNAESDVRQGRERGIETVHYAATHPRPVPAGPGPAHAVAAGLGTYAGLDASRSLWWRVGFAAGAPATFALRRWLAEKAKADRLDLMLLLSRDGYGLAGLWPEEAVPARYFRGSRVLFTLAGASEREFEALVPFLLSGGLGLTVGELFERIGLDPPAESLLADLGLSAETPFTRRNERAVESLLRVIRRPILQACLAARRGLHAACREAGLREGMRVGVFDLGWRGSTQVALERALAPLVGVSVRGYYLCLRAEVANAAALLAEAGLPARTQKALYENRVAAELLFSAPHGSVRGCLRGADGGPRFEEDPGRDADPRLPGVAAEIEAGIRAGVAEIERLSASVPVDLGPLALTAPLLRLATAPTPEEAREIGGLHNFDAWGSSRLRRTYAARREAGIKRLRGDAWPAGLAALPREET